LGERSVADSAAPLGYATTRVLDRLLASCGLLAGAGLTFTAADDVPQAGVLCALPALLAEGLLRHTRKFYTLAPGYYPLESVFLYLALLALVRCRSLEQTRYQAPGEWGRMLGLDRLPEVKTLRAKVAALCATAGRAAQWQTCLAKEWMAAAAAPSSAEACPGLFYVDGHVRLYHGALTKLPRRYVARQRLCLRGTTDYWVNGLGGEPFFVVTEPVHAGLIATLRSQIIPRLLADAPPPTPAASEGRWSPRCTVVFDREGFSPALFTELQGQGVAILTYHKQPGEPWPATEFSTQAVRLHTGETVERPLAERGTRLANGLWVREVRLLATEGHQSSILTTHPTLDLRLVATRMVARWSQENYFKYMRENFGLDRIIEYGTTALPATTVVVNPARRRLEADLRRLRAGLRRLHAQLGALELPADPTPAQCEAFQTQGGEVRAALAAQTAQLELHKARRAQTPPKVTMQELPENERFTQLCPESKHFIDTIKILAYRAESALAGELRENLARDDDARALLRRLFHTPANLRPDYAAGTLTVELHRLGSPLQDAAVAQLCEFLTATETSFPTTELRLIYRQMGSS
jgi:transposase-like protein